MSTASLRSSSELRSLRHTLAIGGLAVVAAAALVACQPAVPGAHAAPAPAEAPTVPVSLVVQSALENPITQVARVEASQRVDLQARVAGPIDTVLFREGEIVRAGQPLFQIDARPYDAAVARSRADLRLAQAHETLTVSEAERAKQLHADHAIAAEEFERRTAAHAEAQARRGAAEASLQTALLEREFTLVRAPIAGRIGRALVTAGNFVAAGSNPTPLASVVSVNTMDVHFDVADRGVLQRLAGDRGMKGWKARILDADGQRELAHAPVDFADHSIDASTGTLRLRARIDVSRAPQTLIPGQYVRVQLSTGQTEAALLVPDQAVGTDQGRRYVLVVDTQGQVQYRPVTVGTSHEQQRLVTSGLKAGEQVIVAGLMRVRPGMTVRPQRVADVAPAQSQGASATKAS